MKTVLIIAYYFPPSPAVGGVRALGLANYLPEFGWEPVILTVSLPNREDLGFRVLETEHRESFGFLRRLLGLDVQQNLMTQVAQLKRKLHIRSERSMVDLLLRAVGELTLYPDPQRGWRRFAVEAGEAYLQRVPVDAIISTSSPVTSHRVARQLKKKCAIPWVADFRDLWTQNLYYPYSRVRRRIERRLELETISGADCVVTVSEPAAAKLGRLHSDKPVQVIRNGFDPKELNRCAVELTEKFTITYTGNLYPGKQSPEPLLGALRELISQEKIDETKVEVRFYGAEAGWIEALAEAHGLKHVVKQYGMVPREVALGRQRESQVLLLLKWNDASDQGYYSAKLFEYLAARRPILAVGGYHDVISDLLLETRAGRDCPNTEDAKVAIRELYEEYQAAGKVAYDVDPNTMDQYTQREMARKFGAVLDSVSR